MNRKKYVLFALDGTLIDSEVLHERAFRETLHQLWPEAEAGFDYEKAKGRTTREVFMRLGEVTEKRLHELVVLKQRLYREAVQAGELYPLPSARRLLQKLSAQGIRVYLVTSGGKQSVAAALRMTGLETFFLGMVTSDDASRAKPTPDLFLCALDKFALHHEETVVIQHSGPGVEGARAAGLDVVVMASRERGASDLLILSKLLAEETASAN